MLDAKILNHIRMAGNLPQFGMQSYAIQLAGSNNTFYGNKITGYGDYGAYLLTGSSNNNLHGNNMALLEFPDLPIPPSAEEPGLYYLYYFEPGVCGNTIKGYTGGNNRRVWDPEHCNDVSGVK